MELQLGLALSSSLAKGRFNFDLNQDYHETNDGKYPYDEPQKNMGKSFLTKRKIDDAKDDVHFVIGWPPVNSRRINQTYYRQNYYGGHPAANCVRVKNSAAGGGRGRGGGSDSLFVKVKMEGIGIARKIDLNLYNSHQTLVLNLIGMFGKCGEDVGKYNLMYQDKQGDWLVARDVPWV
ncbi:auxin-responsive protein IAA13-like isoform X2 [Henckelia pumila]